MAAVGTSQAELTFRMQLERLNWPVRLVRWVAAREYGAILSVRKYRKKAVSAYLKWLETRSLESQIISGLAVLLCTNDRDLPPFGDVCTAITKPSITVDILLQHIYGYGNRKGGWLTTHSGFPPPDFEIEKYFDDHKSAHVPMIFSINMERLERRYGFPFTRQWAFEWRAVMDSTGSIYSDYPYHFVGTLVRSEVTGQFDLAQSDVYRSAYLRVLAFAVANRILSAQEAGFYGMDCLPLNREMLRLRPTERPGFLSDLPEQCCDSSASLEVGARRIIAARTGRTNVRPVSLHIPIKASLFEFGDLSVSAIMATDDFVPNDEDERYFSRSTAWPLPDALSFSGALDEEESEKFLSPGKLGACLPVCLSLMPLPYGYWHGDYFQIGIPLPAAYNFTRPPDVECEASRIVLRNQGNISGELSVWHDQWSPLYAKGGSTRCGMITEMDASDLAATLSRNEMRLGWVVQLRLWSRPTDYGEYALKTRREFFFD